MKKKRFEIDIRSEVSRFPDFLKDLEAVRDEAEGAPKRTGKWGHTWYFRGDKMLKKVDKTPKPLVPSIGEECEYCGKVLDFTIEKREENLLDRFRRFAYQELNGITSEWEALFLGRHYKLPTRILDWSASPLVALYFSCSPRDSEVVPGVGWGILRDPDEENDIKIFEQTKPLKLFPKGERAVKLIYPVYNSGRIRAQKGVFTWHSHPKEDLAAQAGTDYDDLDIIKLVKWPINIDKPSREHIVKEL